MKRIVKRCVKMRQACGHSQRYLAAMMGLSQPYICMMERGKANPARLVEFWSRLGLKAA